MRRQLPEKRLRVVEPSELDERLDVVRRGRRCRRMSDPGAREQRFEHAMRRRGLADRELEESERALGRPHDRVVPRRAHERGRTRGCLPRLLDAPRGCVDERGGGENRGFRMDDAPVAGDLARGLDGCRRVGH